MHNRDIWYARLGPLSTISQTSSKQFKWRFSREKTFDRRVEIYREMIDFITGFLSDLFEALVRFKNRREKMAVEKISAFSSKGLELCRRMALFCSPPTFHLCVEVISQATDIAFDIDQTNEYRDINPSSEETKVRNRLFHLLNQMRIDLFLNKLTDEWLRDQQKIMQNGYRRQDYLSK
jgi:hypothetical protein